MAASSKTYGQHGRPYIFFDPFDGHDLNERYPGQEEKHKVVHYLYKCFIAATREYHGLSRMTPQANARNKERAKAHPEVGKAARRRDRQTRECRDGIVDVT